MHHTKKHLKDYMINLHSFANTWHKLILHMHNNHMIIICYHGIGISIQKFIVIIVLSIILLSPSCNSHGF